MKCAASVALFEGNAMDLTPLSPPAFRAPAILLSGPVDYEMYKAFRGQLDQASQQDVVVVELSTLGETPRWRA
jgi:hypothetical protein